MDDALRKKKRSDPPWASKGPPKRRAKSSGDWLFPTFTTRAASEEQSSLVDVVDKVLNKGAVVNGDVILGVANVDLIYAKLSVLLAALDKVTTDPVFRPVAGGPRRKPKRPKR